MSTSTASSYAPGALIANSYRLVRVIGNGAMGEVWEATNVRLDARVAIKLIQTERSHRSARDRLMQEARATASLRHRAIIRVFDVGQTELGDPFVVMELLSGESLGDRIMRRGPLSPGEAVKILLPVIDALSKAHSRGIVHRDVKPDNIFLERSEQSLQPKLLDFGLVKLEEETSEYKLTETGVTVGSPAYMSPEQARGYSVGPEADLWAICIILYEAICGAMPFQADNYNALLREIIESPLIPIPANIAQDAPVAIIERGLDKDIAKRWNSADELGRALAAWAEANQLQTDISGSSIAARWGSSSQAPPVQNRPSSEQPTSNPFAETMESDAHGLTKSAVVQTDSGLKRRWLLLVAAFMLGGVLLLALKSGPEPAASDGAESTQLRSITASVRSSDAPQGDETKPGPPATPSSAEAATELPETQKPAGTSATPSAEPGAAQANTEPAKAKQNSDDKAKSKAASNAVKKSASKVKRTAKPAKRPDKAPSKGGPLDLKDPF